MRTLLTALTAALSLGACSTLPTEQPDQMLRQAMKRQFTHDNQYRFNGEMRFTMPNLGQTEDESWVKHFMDSLSLPVSGAVDLPAGKVEMTAEIRYRHPNVLASVKLPILLDMKQAALYADARAVTTITDLLDKKYIPKVGDKMLKLSLPEEERKQFPLKTLAKALPEAFDQSYASLPKERFQLREMDEYGKQSGAAYRVGYRANGNDSMRMGQAFGDSLSKQLEQQGGEEGISAENYQKAVELLKKIGQLYHHPAKLLSSDILPAEEQEKMQQTMQKSMQEMEMDDDVYLDRKGRIVARKMTVFSTIDDSDKKLHATIMSRLQYGKPQFTLQPDENNTLNVNCIFDKSPCPWESSEREGGKGQTDKP